MTEQENYQSSVAQTQMYTHLSALKIRLDTNPHIESLREYLSGTHVMIIEQNGQIIAKHERIGEPLVNNLGLQAIMKKISAVFNSQVVQGNLDEESYQMFILEFDRSLNLSFAINYHRWGVSTQNKQLIYDTLMQSVILFLTRPIDNLERESYADTVKHLETTTIGGKELKGMK